MTTGMHPEAKGDFINCVQAARIVPGRPTAQTIWRWAVKGVRSRNAGRVYLRHVLARGQVYTREAWVFEFAEQLAEANRVHES